ncbi:MAG: hypothetical protein HYY41_04040 [Chloroflexi bacterium]|nr:hypothetical protein [Chloroflexota bacterium]
MITTVTTVTTVTVIAALGLSALISMAAVVTLIGFLVTRELATTGHSGFALRIARFASVGIIPLVMAFAAIVAIRVTGLL